MVVGKPPTSEGQSPVTKDIDTLPAPRPTSVKQIEANRKNAVCSRGPTTSEGKKASRLNALKHGLRAKEVIILGQENAADFDAMMWDLREDLKPEGHMESHLVDQIGLDEWRLHRVYRAQLGEIRRQMSSATESDVEDEIERTFEDSPGFLPQILGKSSAGIAYQLEGVEDALDELESEGTVSKDTCDYLERVFGRGTDSPAPMLKLWFLGEMPEGDEEDFEPDDEPTSTVDEGDKQAAARKLLDTTLKDLGRQERKLRKQERTDLEIVRQRLSIPRGPEVEDIQRYETSITRHLHRTIDLLVRLQRRQRGEPPPPTVNVNVTSDDDD